MAHGDLIAAGVTDQEIKRRLRNRRLIPQWRGVYLVGHPDPAKHALEYAALRFAGPTAALSDMTAGRLYGLPLRPSPTIHLSLSEKRTNPKGLTLHTRRLQKDEITTVYGDLRITTPARTLLDLARQPHLEQLVADAVRRELTTHGELVRMLERHRGERGTKRLRDVIAQGPVWTASQLERRFLDLLRKAQLPLPESNLLMGRTKPDLVWREPRVLVELDSRGFHADWIAQRIDRAKDRTRTIHGWTCLRYTTEEVREQGLMVIAEMAAVLAGSRSRNAAA